MTVKWSAYVQNLTDRSMKGMLTGPVNILNWSFLREDISLKESAYQIALTIREEVLDLEANGISIIQVDEAALRELRTNDIIEDVRTQRSELGILFISNFNREVILRILQNNDLQFVPQFTAKPHVFVSSSNPLAKKKSVTREDLLAYPRLTYDQGINNSFYFSEELHSTDESPKSIIVSDRATLFNLLIGLDGYTIFSGILSSDLNGTDIASIPRPHQGIAIQQCPDFCL